MRSAAKGAVNHWVPLLLFTGFLALRLPFRAEFLINWDAVNFALGTQLFSLEHHQPHPPGYIGYVAVGWLLNHITGDPNISLTTLSIIGGSAAPAAFFLLASQFMPQRHAAMSAILFGLSPVVWYYSGVALTYALEVALALFFLWSGFVARKGRSFRYLIVASTLLVLLGAMRQSGAVFLMPLWLYLVWAFPWRQRLLAGGVVAVGNLTWLLPLLWLSGGIISYMQASASLAKLVVMPTSVFALNPLAMGQNIGFVLIGIIVGTNLGLLIIAIGLRSGANAFAIFARHRAYFLLWLIPVLLTYLLVHTGQLGYVLLVLPAAFLLVGTSISKIGEQRPVAAWRSAAVASGHLFARRYVLASLLALLAVANAATFLFAPQVVYALVNSDKPSTARKLTTELFETLPLFHLAPDDNGSNVADRARQYNVKLNDTHWDNLIEFVSAYDPDETAVLAVPDSAGSFRHFTYYLPEYRVYGLGRDLDDSFGHLFTAYEGTSDYAVEGMEKARRVLELPAGVRQLIVPDYDVYQRMYGFETEVINLENDTQGFLVRVPPGTSLVFQDTDEDDAWIVPQEIVKRH